MSVIRRLPRYQRYLEELISKGVERISSREFAGLIGLTASQVRQDLNCFGGFGQQGYGYNVQSLRLEIERILSVDKKKRTILLGAGNLGLAILNHMQFEKRGFELIGIFDNSEAIIGQDVRGWIVKDTREIEDFCKEHKPSVAIFCIPKIAAEIMAKKLVDLGVKAFWNFSHYDIALAYGDQVAVENVHLGDSLSILSFRFNELS